MEVRPGLEASGQVLELIPGLRHDARRPYELRSLSFQLLPHPHADGSATVSQGLTSVQVVIYGPREPKSRSSSHPEKAVISVEVGVVPWAQSGGAKKSRGDRYVLFHISLL
jgi:exosome complex component RRP41